MIEVTCETRFLGGSRYEAIAQTPFRHRYPETSSAGGSRAHAVSKLVRKLSRFRTVAGRGRLVGDGFSFPIPARDC